MDCVTLKKPLEQGYPPKVIVHWDEKNDREYMREVLSGRRKNDGKQGRVILYQTGHGICFQVQFDDNGEVAWYEPSECELL